MILPKGAMITGGLFHINASLSPPIFDDKCISDVVVTMHTLFIIETSTSHRADSDLCPICVDCAVFYCLHIYALKNKENVDWIIDFPLTP